MSNSPNTKKTIEATDAAETASPTAAEKAAGVKHSDIHQAEREQAFEYGLPSYLQHDLDAYKDGLKSNSGLMDCLWGELYGSINIAEINDGIITVEHADYLRKKYLYSAKV